MHTSGDGTMLASEPIRPIDDLDSNTMRAAPNKPLPPTPTDNNDGTLVATPRVCGFLLDYLNPSIHSPFACKHP
jgi:hypothetical protein